MRPFDPRRLTKVPATRWPVLALGTIGVVQGLATGGRGVSGGERARLGLARGLVSQRRVLLLDEPVAHLDHATADAVMGGLTRSITRRTRRTRQTGNTAQTVIMVSHRRDGLAGFDRVIDLARQTVDPARIG